MSAPELRCEGLVFTWPAGASVGPIDLRLGPGVHHLQGRNGSGKTTLLRCLCGELRPASGAVRVCGEDPLRHRARRLVAFSPAALDLPGYLRVDEAWQILAALRGAPRWDGRAIRDRLGLPGTLRLSHGSAGQRRLAGLLAALAGDPPVLLLDEPLANVDAERSAELGALIAELGRERVVLLTSHEAPPFPVRDRRRLRVGVPLIWRS